MIAVVIPSCRPESYEQFLLRWNEQFLEHNVDIILVQDGDTPTIYLNGIQQDFAYNADLIPNRCAGVRNMGFQFIAERMPAIEYIVSLDDDMSPDGDTIGDHIRTLNTYLPISWFSTMLGEYPRGYPYAVRNEAPVILSHGIWKKNPDWDAPTQLLNGNKDHTAYYKGAIPKHAFFPFCGMNVAFRRKALPYVYYAPVNTFKGAERFDDIYAGIAFKPDFDTNNWAVATGYASCIHERESNVFINLEKEAVGIRYNEDYWKGEVDHPWFKEFSKKRKKWYNTMIKYV